MFLVGGSDWDWRGTVHVAMFLASASDASQNFGEWGNIAQFGFLGLLVIDLIGTHKFIVPRWTLDALNAERDRRETLMQGTIERLEKEVADVKEINGQLQDMTRERLMPALTQAVDSQRAVVEVLGRRVRERD